MQMKYKTFPVLFLLLLIPATGFTQDSLWKTYIDAGTKAYEEGQYSEAERRFDLARKESESSGAQDLRVALSYYNLALVYLKQEGKLAEALKHSRQALAIWEKITWGNNPRTESLQVARNLENLASALLSKKEYADIELLLKQAIVIKKKVLRPEHPTIAVTLGYLAITNFLQKNYDDSDAHCGQALAIYKKAGDAARYGDIIQAFRTCALINQYRKNYTKAEEFLFSAIELREKSREPEYIDSGTLNALANLYRIQNRDQDVERVLLRRFAIIKEAYGLNDSNVALALDSLADVYIRQRNYTKAESLYKEALANLEKASDDTRQTRLKMFDGLLSVYRSERAYAASEALLQQCLKLAEELVGTEHPLFAGYLNAQGSLFLDQEKYVAAEPVFKRALDIREKALPPENSDIAQSLNNLAKDYYYQGKYVEAEPLYIKAISISQKLKDPSPSDWAWYTKNYALLLYAQGKTAQAEPLFEKARKFFAENQRDRDVAFSLYELAELYRRQKKYEEAEAWFKKAIPLMEKASGQNQYEVATTLDKYAALLRETGRESEAIPFEARVKEIKSTYARKP